MIWLKWVWMILLRVVLVASASVLGVATTRVVTAHSVGTTV